MTDLFPQGLTTAERFFYKHAGVAYTPAIETEEEGRIRGARALAAAEAWAGREGYSFEWIEDERDSSEWSDDPEPWAQWVCLMHAPDGIICDSLSGIDFGRDGSPWSDPYRRVVEAELAAGEKPAPVDVNA